MTPAPSHSSHSCRWYTPSAAIASPPDQHAAATTPALRGPADSSQCPNSAADEPSRTKNNVYVQPSCDTGHPSDCDSGNQNTLNPYAMPMHRWMASAAGGMSQRLKPGAAMVRRLSSSPQVDGIILLPSAAV
jgi:hypothetical protein